MRYSVDWSDVARNTALEERATVADLRIWLGSVNVTQNLRGTANYDHVTLALYGIAEGLAYDWWNIFGGRDRVVSWRNYRNGFVLPDIQVRFDGTLMEVAAQQFVYDQTDVRFWAGPIETLDRAAAERVFERLVEDVLERLKAAGFEASNACERWKKVLASRADDEEASFCESAGALGLDPYRISDLAADRIERAAELFILEPLTEFLAGAANADTPRLLDWVNAAESRDPRLSRVPHLKFVAEDATRRTPARPLEQAWALGYRRARAMRTSLGLEGSHRFRTYLELAGRLGAASAFELADPVDGLRALRAERQESIEIHLRKAGAGSAYDPSYLFTMARAIGDVACFPGPDRAPINDLKSAYRQSAGRAFAAEFLAPIAEILAMREDGRDAVSMSEEFAVSSAVIDHQIENRHRIEAACTSVA